MKNNVNIPDRLKTTMGEIDHREMKAPFVRLVSCQEGTSGQDKVYLFDLRISQPNQDSVEMVALHTLEHLLAYGFKARLPGFVNLGPMGCQTGFYLTTFNQCDYELILSVLEAILEDVITKADNSDIPYYNDQDCGWAENHSLEKSQQVARKILDKRAEWNQVLAS